MYQSQKAHVPVGSAGRAWIAPRLTVKPTLSLLLWTGLCSPNETDVVTACVTEAARDVHADAAQRGREQFPGHLFEQLLGAQRLGRRLLVLFPQAVSPLPPMRAAVLLPQDLPGAGAGAGAASAR